MPRASAFIILALALAGTVRAQDNQAEKDFKAALEIQNEREMEKACRTLVTLGTESAAKCILTGLTSPKVDTNTYWIMIRACAAFGNSGALKAVTDYALANKAKPIGKDLAMALQNNFSGAAEAAMLALLKEGSEEQRLIALDHLADIGGKDTAQAIVDIMKKEGEKNGSSEVRRRMCVVMKSITKENYGDSVSNWIGWWDANSSKSWDELKKTKEKSGSAGDFGATRAEELDKLREGNKVLILHAGNKCKCKKDHDLDPNLDKVLQDIGVKFDKITKDQLDANNGKLDSGEVCNLKDYLAIIAICTHIRVHCACPKCKPGGQQSMRLFQ